MFKVANISQITVLTMDGITICKVEGEALSVKPGNYHATLQFNSALQKFSSPQLYCSGSLSPLSSTIF